MKESKNLDKLVVFRERFIDEQTTRANFGTPTAVTFDKGVGNFNGTSSIIDYGPSVGRLKQGTTQGSIRLRIKPTDGIAAAAQYIIARYKTTGNQREWGVNITTAGKLALYTSSDGLVAQSLETANAVFPDGQASRFYECLITFSGTTGAIYIDGLAVALGASNVVASIFNSSSNLTLGNTQSGGTNYYTGDIELIEIYNTSLTAEDAYNLANNKRFKNEKISDSTESLGADFVPNGNFATNDTWTLGVNTSITGGQLVCTNWVDITSNVVQILGATLIKTNKYYKVTVKVDELTGGNLVVRNSSGRNNGQVQISSTGITTGYISFGSDTNFVFTGSVAGVAYKVDYVTLQEVQNMPMLMDFDSTQGVLEDKSGLRTLTPTNVSIRRFGSIFGAYFDLTGKIDCGADFIGTKNITINSWIYPTGNGGGGFGRILDNGRLFFFIFNTTYQFDVSSDGTEIKSANNSWQFNKPVMVTVTRNSVGRVYFYVNGVLSGTASQDSGVPGLGSTNLIIGNNNASARGFQGYIFTTQILEGFASTNQISQWYSSQKLKYNS